MVGGDDLEHEVDRGNPARRRPAVAVHDVDRLRQLHILEFLGETVLVFPVDRRLLAVQRPALARAWPPVQMPPMVTPRRASRRSQLTTPFVVVRWISRPPQTRIVSSRSISSSPSSSRNVAPLEQDFSVPSPHSTQRVKRLARNPVGNAQGFDGPGKGDHRELVQKHEDEPP